MSSEGLKKSTPKKTKREKGSEPVQKKKAKTETVSKVHPKKGASPSSFKTAEVIVQEEKKGETFRETRVFTEKDKSSETGSSGGEGSETEPAGEAFPASEMNSPERDSPENSFKGSQSPIYQEFYLNGYCLRDDSKVQFYAKNHSGDEMYWRDSVNAETYAYKEVKVDGSTVRMEYPATKNDEPYYIYDRAGKPRYPVNLNTNHVLFPRNSVTNEEMYLTDRMGYAFYPENKFGEQFYCKDAEGNDRVIQNRYAQYATGSQKYPKKSNGDEFYLQSENRDVPAVKLMDQTLVPYYAEKANGDQIYPREYSDSEMEEAV